MNDSPAHFDAPAPPPAPAFESSAESAPTGGGEGDGARDGGPREGGFRYSNNPNNRRRRRRRRGPDREPRQDGRPGQGAPPYADRGDRPERGGRRGRRGRSQGGDAPRPQRRRGLEVLRQMQNIGAALDPTERLILELPAGQGSPPDGDRITGRALDLIAPLGRGQRCLLVAPPKAGKTRILQCIAASIAHNHPEIKVYALLVDERPEEVTDFRRNTPAEVIAASSDMSAREHIECAEEAMDRVAQEVIDGKDVVLLLDSITRLARAYNSAAGNGGRTMSGGLDSNAMQAPRQIFGSARKIENGGSLTIIGTALIDTGSRMDQIIFEEFKGTGNSEIYLSRELAERRIFPAIDIAKSGTRKEEKLIPAEQLGTFQTLRRVLLGMPLQESMSKLIDRLQKTPTNEQFYQLVRVGES